MLAARIAARALRSTSPRLLQRSLATLSTLLLPGGAYDNDAVRAELRRAKMGAAISGAMALSPHTADDLSTVLSLLQS